MRWPAFIVGLLRYPNPRILRLALKVFQAIRQVPLGRALYAYEGLVSLGLAKDWYIAPPSQFESILLACGYLEAISLQPAFASPSASQQPTGLRIERKWLESIPHPAISLPLPRLCLC